MNIDRLRQKIRKLLALAASGSGHEAASAGRHASRLMAEHDLRLEDLGEEPPHVLLVAGRSWPIWRRTLLTFAAQSNEVEALFRLFRKQSEAKLTGEMVGCQRALTFYLDLVRVCTELETMLGKRLVPYLMYFQGLGSRKATDSVRRGIAYGLIRLHTAKTTVILVDDPDLADVKKTTVKGKPASPSSTDRRSGSQTLGPGTTLARIEESRWESMGDSSKLFEAASQELFEFGERLARRCVVVDEAGYAQVVDLKSEVRDGTDD